MQTKENTPLITDQALAEMAAPDVQACMGEWDDATRAFLAIAIPEMAAELLQRRQALCIAIHPKAAEQSIERARAIIRAPDPISQRDLMAACRSLLTHSRDAGERSAALAIIAEMEAAA